MPAPRRSRGKRHIPFPFVRLPAELQMLVLSRCDPVAAAGLVASAPGLKTLMVRYPGNIVQAVLSQLPPPIAALLRVSSDLHNLPDDDFDATTVLHFLQHSELFEWPLLQPTPLNLTADPVGVMSTIANLYLEVDEAAKVIGECMAVGVETFLDPFAKPRPAPLLDTEHVRIACSLWVTKIYYQMRAKFSHQPPEIAHKFPEAFIKGLKPWQIDQSLAIDRFLRAYRENWMDSLHRIANAPPALLERLSQSTYINEFFAIYGPQIACTQIVHLDRAAENLQRDHHLNRPDLHAAEDVGHPSRDSPMANPLRNHAWLATEPRVVNGQVERRFNYHRDMFRHLGFFFWDVHRVKNYQHVASDGLRPANFMYNNFLHRVGPYTTRAVYSRVPMSWQLDYIERSKHRQVLEWTRCPEQLTLEEWLHQRTVKYRIDKDQESMPAKYITAGAVCTSCGLDGHWAGRCRSDSWSDDEGGEQSDSSVEDSG